MVAPRALACRPPASTPTARVRVCAIAASCSHAEFAENDPDGRCANGPSTRSANASSIDRVPAVLGFGLQHRERGVGEERVVAVVRQQLTLTARRPSGSAA